MEAVTDREKGALALIRLNELMRKREVFKRLRLGHFETTFHWRSAKNFWGRFGGGWNWCLGFELGDWTLGLNLLVFRLGFSLLRGDSGR